MKQLATALLLLVAILFVLAHHYSAQYPWLSWAEAFTEAALVGALADWFAVTALFRHPLGIPVPHTAIISKNKDRIADTLGEFIETNFLTQSVLRERLEKIDPLSSLSGWLYEGDRLRAISREVSRLLLRACATLGEDKIVRSLTEWLQATTAQSALVGRGLGSLLNALLDADKSGVLFERAIQYARDLLRTHSGFLREHLRKELPWYVPRFVHDKIYHAMIERLERYFAEIVRLPTHPARAEFMKYAGALAHELSYSPRTQEQLAHWFNAVLSDDTLREYVRKVWNSVLSTLQEDHERGEHSEVVMLTESLSRHVISTFLADNDLKSRGNAFIRDTVLLVIDRHRAQVGSFIAQTMKTWDNETLVSKVEENIGEDLQFVRINGTLVGGIVGVVLYAFKVLTH